MADDKALSIVEFEKEHPHKVHCLRRPFERSAITTNFNGAVVGFPLAELIQRAQAPASAFRGAGRYCEAQACTRDS
ncbi:MAG: hypothetical protein ACYC0T_11415 [Ramlibacter sp.]